MPADTLEHKEAKYRQLIGWNAKRGGCGIIGSGGRGGPPSPAPVLSALRRRNLIILPITTLTWGVAPLPAVSVITARPVPPRRSSPRIAPPPLSSSASPRREARRGCAH
ncbi:hypothetical protein E2C01_026994 [Portunus trituberculatus]|uniref:Uncharacterized protein n=1 Tax=Portunus trituberculatus TaxID=210409 RepID=A0A5B7EKH4_PORTR|nr:hypothetical protein [Portunus trituberculatus]